MSLVVACPNGHRWRVKDEDSGRPVRCPKCGSVVRVQPAEARPAARPESSDPSISSELLAEAAGHEEALPSALTPHSEHEAQEGGTSPRKIALTLPKWKRRRGSRPGSRLDPRLKIAVGIFLLVMGGVLMVFVDWIIFFESQGTQPSVILLVLLGLIQAAAGSFFYRRHIGSKIGYFALIWVLPGILVPRRWLLAEMWAWLMLLGMVPVVTVLKGWEALSEGSREL